MVFKKTIFQEKAKKHCTNKYICGLSLGKNRYEVHQKFLHYCPH